ncbi:hypothetical protein MSSAC_1645 [Methanosarcina siciliae C2J]|uniref:Uncharacterized protein n=1 Tax=Methanosarcina siciliae C2J TaxID=1434118 RepID=A0A0E3PMV8_9EURY|nr:hypothetical protein [Methanosarcina siciliae]AKB36235.1 hypothetical protein MSSAC_1645 [Methanosarcina siciliae C2J]
MKLFDLTKFFTLKKISIFSVLLIMFSVVPSCALAEEETTEPSLPEEDFDTMQSRMTESVDRMIETLENSTEEIDDETLASAEELISGLTSIKEEISEAESESDLQKIREELDTLLEEAPEELKSISGFGMMGPGPEQAQNGSQNGSQVPPQGAGNMSEERPERPEGANAMGENASTEKQGMSGQAPDEQEETNNAENAETESSTETGFFASLLNSLKSHFS